MSRNKDFKELLPAFILAAVILSGPIYLTNNYILTIICQGMIFSIVALGMNFITGMSGLMNLGAAAVYGLGAYTTALLTTTVGISPWLALLPVMVMGFLIGVGLGYPSLKVHGVYLSLATIGFNEIIRMLLTNLQFTGGGSGVRGIPPYSLFGFPINTPMRNYYFIFVAMVICVAIARRIVRSKWGRAFLAVKDNPEALEVCGVSLASTKVAAFTLSAVFGCVGGALYAHFNHYVSPTTFRVDLSISFVIMLIVGGLGNFWGCIVGAFVVALLPEAMRFIGTPYKLVYALLMMMLVVFFPGGIQREIKKLFLKLLAMGKGGARSE